VRSSEKDGDFIIRKCENAKNAVNVAAIDSPGLSSCVAIAEYTVSILFSLGLSDKKNENFIPTRKDPHFFKKMADDQKDAYIKEHREYGKIVCRCEGVSEGEILYAINTNPPARSLDAVKRRTRSGMGRCQSGFCAPYVMKLISRSSGIPMEKISKRGEGSEMLVGKI
jgi:glycerol-3-phosphate dehydrogenase